MEEAGGVRLGTATGRWVLAACVLGSGLAGIDATVVNIALPDIASSLHVGFSSLQWTVTAYTITLASLILLAARWATGSGGGGSSSSASRGSRSLRSCARSRRTRSC